MTPKEQIISTFENWASTKIDTLVSNSPNMAMVAPRLKNGMSNYIAKNSDKIDNMLLFFTDKEGKLDVGNFFEEATKVFDDMPIQTHKIFGMDLNVGKGAVELDIPQNFFTSMLMGSNNSVKLTSADFMEIKDLLMAKMIKP